MYSTKKTFLFLRYFRFTPYYFSQNLLLQCSFCCIHIGEQRKLYWNVYTCVQYPSMPGRGTTSSFTFEKCRIILRTSIGFFYEIGPSLQFSNRFEIPPSTDNASRPSLRSYGSASQSTFALQTFSLQAPLYKELNPAFHFCKLLEIQQRASRHSSKSKT